MIPETINQGDSVAWVESESNYPASDGWVIGYNLVMTGQRINFESIADGSDHDFSLLVATTTAWQPGNYNFQRYVTNGTDRTTLNNGVVEIKRDYLTAGDDRSQAQRTLDAIEAVIEQRATLDQEEYTIRDRSLKRMNISDLLKFRDIYRAEVARERNAERIAQGLGTKQTITVRF